MKKVISVLLVGVMTLSLMACGTKEEEIPELKESVVAEMQEIQSEENQEDKIVEEGSESETTEVNTEIETIDETSSTSSLVGKTYKKADGTTLEILSSDSNGYINAIELDGIEIYISNIQFLEGHYAPDENTYYGEFNNGIDRIGISCFTKDDTKLLIRLEIGSSSDGSSKEAEVEVTQDGEYYLE